ncbi:YbjN domain-containing protein [Streptomyces zingiberis]|uniref:YbjN domain-containing protein n=1 Tax=Streptomyces zingiberis TaxID=2053010 RepID=A0ABX1BUB6_9ACTN|nr:YbjN domain-containing protein [Streptomyces zingiberis]NJQ00043.1 YbjN domain-containing protein [Streptomyces zingiberis]
MADLDPQVITETVEKTLDDAELSWDSPSDGHYVVTLPGERKLSTTCSLVVGKHSLSVNAFVVRHPDENEAAVHRWLLERNTKLYGVSYAVDRLGDIYLVGKLPLSAVTPEELDRLLGTVLENADGSFNTLLEMGFASAIRKEHEWRTARGESTRNLEAFTRLTGERPAPAAGEAGSAGGGEADGAASGGETKRGGGETAGSGG